MGSTASLTDAPAKPFNPAAKPPNKQPLPQQRSSPLASASSSGISPYRRFRLFLVVLAVVAVLSVAKAVIHWAGIEFLSLNPLFTSAIAGAIFIIGFLLSSVMHDYKEAERLPADMRVALEVLRDDAASFARRQAGVDMEDLDQRLANIVASVEAGLRDGDHHRLDDAAAAVAGLSTAVSALEGLGMPPNYIVRLRAAQDVLRKAVFRITHIQRMQFVPSAYVLVQSLVGLNLFLLLFLKTEGSPESALMFGFISYMFVYALYLINTLEQPFRKGRNSVDDVSLFLIRDFNCGRGGPG